MSPARAKKHWVGPTHRAGAPMSPVGAKRPYRGAKSSTLRQPE